MMRSIASLLCLCITVLLGASAVPETIENGTSAELSLSTLRNRIRDLNLGLAGSTMFVDGTTAVFTVPEQGQRRDLNGDGDQDDFIVHVFDATLGTVRNLGVGTSTSMLLQGRVLAFWAPEGSVDLNGDGDLNDIVLHVYDTVRRSLSNLRLAGREFSGLFTDERRLAFCVEERAQNMDLNRDSDIDDCVAHTYDLLTRRVQSTGLGVSFVSPQNLTLGDRWMAIGVFEGGIIIRLDGTIGFGVDLNGNGGINDDVVHLFDTVTGQVKNLRLGFGSLRPREPLGFEFGFKVGGGIGLLGVSENIQGVDLNGDADLKDTVLHRIDLNSGSVVNTGITPVSAGQDNVFPSFGSVPPPFTFQEGLAVFNLSETDEGKDLNGDGDATDVVLHSLSTRTGQLRSLNMSAAVYFSDSVPGRAVLFMSESINGKDLNGDGDIGEFSEFVVALADLSGSEPRVVNTGLAITFFPGSGDSTIFFVDATALQIRGNLVSLAVPEEVQGNRDLNGDGDTEDTVLHIADLSTMKAFNTRLNATAAYRSLQAPLFPPVDGRVVLPLNEARQGNRDLNRDGDAEDQVLQTLDVRTGRVRNTGIAVAGDPFPPFVIFDIPLMVRGETFVSLLLDEGGVDLNGDGDTTDRVLHMFDIATGRLTNLRLAPGSSGFPETEADLDVNFIAVSSRSGGFSGFAGASETTDDGPGLGDAYMFVVSEADQGNVDLNGDGDTDDKVIHATRLTDRDRNGRFDFTEGR